VSIYTFSIEEQRLAKSKLSSQSALPTVVEEATDKFCKEINRVCFLTQAESEVRDWLFKLQDEKRLDIALKAFKAIDQQMQIGADVREVVAQVLREIRGDFINVKDDMSSIVSDVRETMDKSVKDYLQNIVEQTKRTREETEKFIKQTVESQVTHVIEKVELLLKQGKSIEEIQRALKEHNNRTNEVSC